MKILKRTNGITLISLIITIIIMIILAGVAISVLIDGDGLFNKTKNAVNLYEQSVETESEMIDTLKNSLDSYFYASTEDSEISSEDSNVKIGDFVNYTVTVDDYVYDKWRVLHKDINGHIEIVCYNGPVYILGKRLDITQCKNDYANSISLLNTACIPFGNGTYAADTRHYGSDPYNPTSYETISTDYIKYYSPDATESTEYKNNLIYLSQSHYNEDYEAMDKIDGKDKLAGRENWVAARSINLNDEYTIFRVLSTSYRGSNGYQNIFYIYDDGDTLSAENDINLVPVVILEDGVYISETDGNGSKEDPWELKK